MFLRGTEDNLKFKNCPQNYRYFKPFDASAC